MTSWRYFWPLAIAATIFIISTCYSHIIEAFPSGGGGYLVASKLLGRRTGALAGSALLVDYVLTITVSIAAAGDALFGLMDCFGSEWKIYAEFAVIVLLILLNLRGVKESIQILLPIFLLFLLTHFLLISGALLWNVSETGTLIRNVAKEVSTSYNNPKIGLLGMLELAYVRLFNGRRNVHRNRGRLELRAGDARAARGHRPADDALHGLVVGFDRRRADRGLFAAGNHQQRRARPSTRFSPNR